MEPTGRSMTLSQAVPSKAEIATATTKRREMADIRRRVRNRVACSKEHLHEGAARMESTSRTRGEVPS
jgi:hypothetical protein